MQSLPKASSASSISESSCNFFTLNFSASSSSRVSSSCCDNRFNDIKNEDREVTYVDYMENFRIMKCLKTKLLDPATVCSSDPLVFSLAGFLSL